MVHKLARLGLREVPTLLPPSRARCLAAPPGHAPGLFPCRPAARRCAGLEGRAGLTHPNLPPGAGGGCCLRLLLPPPAARVTLRHAACCPSWLPGLVGMHRWGGAQTRPPEPSLLPPPARCRAASRCPPPRAWTSLGMACCSSPTRSALPCSACRLRVPFCCRRAGGLDSCQGCFCSFLPYAGNAPG